MMIMMTQHYHPATCNSVHHHKRSRLHGISKVGDNHWFRDGKEKQANKFIMQSTHTHEKKKRKKRRPTTLFDYLMFFEVFTLDVQRCDHLSFWIQYTGNRSGSHPFRSMCEMMMMTMMQETSTRIQWSVAASFTDDSCFFSRLSLQRKQSCC